MLVLDIPALNSDSKKLADAIADANKALRLAEEKRLGLATQPAGFVGVETLAPLMINETLAGRLSPERLTNFYAARRAAAEPLASSGPEQNFLAATG